MKIDTVQLKENIERRLNRPASFAELKNAETDVMLLVELLFDEVEKIKEKIKI